MIHFLFLKHAFLWGERDVGHWCIANYFLFQIIQLLEYHCAPLLLQEKTTEVFFYSGRCPWLWCGQTQVITSESPGPRLRWPNNICCPVSFLLIAISSSLLYCAEGSKEGIQSQTLVSPLCVCVGRIKVVNVGDNRKPWTMSTQRHKIFYNLICQSVSAHGHNYTTVCEVEEQQIKRESSWD